MFTDAKSILLGLLSPLALMSQFQVHAPRTGQWLGQKTYGFPSGRGTITLLNDKNQITGRIKSPVEPTKGIENLGKAERSTDPYHVDGAWHVTTRKIVDSPGLKEVVTLRRWDGTTWEIIGSFEGAWGAPTIYPCSNGRFLFVTSRNPAEPSTRGWSPFQMYRLTPKGTFEFQSFIALDPKEELGLPFELDLGMGARVLMDHYLVATAPNHGHLYLLDLNSGTLRLSHRLFPELQAKLPKLDRPLPVPTILFTAPLKEGDLLLASRSEQAVLARAEELALSRSLGQLQAGAGSSQRSTALKSTQRAVDDLVRGHPVVEWWLLDTQKRTVKKTSPPRGSLSLLDTIEALRNTQLRPYSDGSVHMGSLREEDFTTPPPSASK